MEQNLGRRGLLGCSKVLKVWLMEQDLEGVEDYGRLWNRWTGGEGAGLSEFETHGTADSGSVDGSWYELSKGFSPPRNEVP